MPAVGFSLHLHQALEVRLGALLELLGRPGWQEEAEPLHQVRVASRRARAALELAEPELYPHFRRQRRRLRQLTRALGAWRELDVHLRILEELKEEPLRPAHEAAVECAQEELDRLRRHRLGAMARELEAIRTKGFAALRRLPEALQGALPDPALDRAEAAQRLSPAAEAALGPLRGLLAEERPGELHAARVRIKRFRYALEVLAPLLGPAATAALDPLHALQTALGDHHDLCTLENFLWSLHGELTARGRAVLSTALLDVLALVAAARERRLARVRERLPAFGAAELLGDGLP